MIADFLSVVKARRKKLAQEREAMLARYEAEDKELEAMEKAFSEAPDSRAMKITTQSLMGASQGDLAAQFSISQSQVSRIIGQTTPFLLQQLSDQERKARESIIHNQESETYDDDFFDD